MNELSQHTGQGEIILYQPDETVRLEVRLEDDTVWLTQAQMAELFQTTRNNVTLHIGHIFKEGELSEFSVRKESLLTALKNHQEKIDFFVRTNQPPVEGVLFEGQIFDAYKLVEALVKSAKREIILIDNYVDAMRSTTLVLRSRTSASASSPSNSWELTRTSF